MPLLVPMPVGLPITSLEPISGPQAVDSGVSSTMKAFQQVVGSPFGAWRWQFTLGTMWKKGFRDYRGWLADMMDGANATVWNFGDPDIMTLLEAGVNMTNQQHRHGMPWSNDLPWSHGLNWNVARPRVSLTAAAAQDDTEIFLADEYWGHTLRRGSFIGFSPGHFGLYIIRRVLDDGMYKIWPPLRGDLDIDMKATLSPRVVFRIEPQGYNSRRDLEAAQGLTITMSEIQNYYVHEYFTWE